MKRYVGPEVKRTYYNISLRLALGCFLFFQSLTLALAEENISEYWTDVGYTFKMGKSSLDLSAGNYFNQKGDWYLINGEIQFSYPVKDKLAIGLGYKQEYTRYEESWGIEYRPMANLFVKEYWGKVKLQNRNRVEFRLKDPGEFSMRYRSRIKASFPAILKIRPYLSTEIFMDGDEALIDRNRAYLGAQLPIEKLTPSFYLCWQRDRVMKHKWNNMWVLGVSLWFKL